MEEYWIFRESCNLQIKCVVARYFMVYYPKLLTWGYVNGIILNQLTRSKLKWDGASTMAKMVLYIE